jgi:hypothetical protein
MKIGKLLWSESDVGHFVGAHALPDSDDNKERSQNTEGTATASFKFRKVFREFN